MEKTRFLHLEKIRIILVGSTNKDGFSTVCSERMELINSSIFIQFLEFSILYFFMNKDS